MTYQWHTSDPACMVTPLISEIKCRASSWFRTQHSKGGVVWESYWNHIIQQIHHDICDDIDIPFQKKTDIQNDTLKLDHESETFHFKERQFPFKLATTFML